MSLTIGGIPIDRKARPACKADYCCGAAFDETTKTTVETCQYKARRVYTFRPMRPKNATKNPATRDIPWACIEGAQKMAVSAIALLSTVYMMA